MTLKLNSQRQKVVVAMSGGVDSSVAAALLVQQGYEVIGMMMRLWSEPGSGPKPQTNRCCTPDQMADARRVADLLGIPFYVLDTQELFYRRIVQFFLDEHAQGRTPNPCIACNREIRFAYLLERAMAVGADFLATGHYARIRYTSAGFELLTAADAAKDQSYVLHVLNQQTLGKVLFPVGDYTKAEIRSMAAKLGLLAVAHKSESMDLCFLSDGDYRRFLAERAPSAVGPGPILDLQGRMLGRHDGLANYTIGQRKGLGISAPEPLYVIRKDSERDTLIVGTRDESGETEMVVRRVNWVAGLAPGLPTDVDVKIRYKARCLPAEIRALDGDNWAVRFRQPVAGITPGQAAVFYRGDVVLGGGTIADRLVTDAARERSEIAAHNLEAR